MKLSRRLLYSSPSLFKALQHHIYTSQRYTQGEDCREILGHILRMYLSASVMKSRKGLRICWTWSFTSGTPAPASTLAGPGCRHRCCCWTPSTTTPGPASPSTSGCSTSCWRILVQHALCNVQAETKDSLFAVQGCGWCSTWWSWWWRGAGCPSSAATEADGSPGSSRPPRPG